MASINSLLGKKIGLTNPSSQLHNVPIMFNQSMASTVYLWFHQRIYGFLRRSLQPTTAAVRLERLAKKPVCTGMMRALRSRQQLSAVDNQQVTHKQQEAAQFTMPGTETSSQVSGGSVNEVDHNHAVASKMHRRASFYLPCRVLRTILR